jgi:hypothetical protein
MGFPKPDRVRGRLYWDEDKLDAWDQARAGAILPATWRQHSAKNFGNDVA